MPDFQMYCKSALQPLAKPLVFLQKPSYHKRLEGQGKLVESRWKSVKSSWLFVI